MFNNTIIVDDTKEVCSQRDKGVVELLRLSAVYFASAKQVGDTSLLLHRLLCFVFHR